MLRASVRATPLGHIDRPSRWNDIGEILSTRYDLTGSEDDLIQAIESYKKSTETPSIPSVDRPIDIRELPERCIITTILNDGIRHQPLSSDHCQ